MALCHLLTLEESQEDEQYFSRQAPPSVSLGNFLSFPSNSKEKIGSLSINSYRLAVKKNCINKVANENKSDCKSIHLDLMLKVLNSTIAEKY